MGNEVTPGGDLVAGGGLMAEKGITLPKMPPLPDIKPESPISNLTNLSISSPSSSGSGKSQKIISAMELPFRAIGSSILKVTGDLRNRLGAVSPAADAKLDNIMNIITNAFGLSSQDSVSTKASSEANSRVRESEIQREESKDDNVKWYDRIKNFVSNVVEKTGDMINLSLIHI